MPAVSIVIVTFNRRDTIADALHSAQAQIGLRTEIAVIDDGSSDGTAAFISKHFPDVRLVIVSHRGIAACRNVGLRIARERLVGFLDSDDVADPRWIAKLFRVLTRSRPSASVAFCGHLLDGRLPKTRIPGRFELLDFAIYCPFALAGCLFDRVTALRLGGYDETLPLCEDWDLMFRLWQEGGARLLREPFYDYRRVDSKSHPRAAPSVTSLNRKQLRYYEQLIRRRNLARFLEANPSLTRVVVRRLTYWANRAPFRYKRSLVTTPQYELVRLAREVMSGSIGVRSPRVTG